MRLYGVLQCFCKWGLERGDFGQAYWVGFVQPALLTSSPLKGEKSTVTMWKPVPEPELWLGLQPKHNFSTLFQVLLEVTVLCYDAISCLHVFSPRLRRRAFLWVSGIVLDQAQNKWDCTYPISGEPREVTAVGSESRCSRQLLWVNWYLEFFVFPHWLRNYLPHLV